MRVLLLAPHPFFQERGTPIAVNLLLKVLSERGEQVDVLTFHEGQDVIHENVNIYRIPSLPFVKGLRPGFSIKKLVCDALLMFAALRLVLKKRYEVIHAVEESVFIALVMKWLFGLSYIYDMDSSLAQQMMEKYGRLTAIAPLLNGCERVAIRNALAVVPVCQALASIAKKNGQPNILILQDVPLDCDNAPNKAIELRKNLDLLGPIVMYVGNLEPYQGIDLLLESFTIVIAHHNSVHLVIIGGDKGDIERYKIKSKELGIQEFVHFLGPRSIDELPLYLNEADLLVSPRVRGNNTPMKIYSYMQSGVPVVATDLPTHTQVLNQQVAILAAPMPQTFAEGMLVILNDPEKGANLGKAAQRLIQEHYSYEAFRQKINVLYDWIKEGSPGQLVGRPEISPACQGHVA